MTRVAPLGFSAAANEDVRTAYLWLEELRPGLGRAFVRELDRLTIHIRNNPAMYQRFRGECRRAVLSRFDYAIVYRVLDDAVQVVGVLHCRLDPALAADRTEAAAG
jgi:plasmid stabilization system protein ParE